MWSWNTNRSKRHVASWILQKKRLKQPKTQNKVFYIILSIVKSTLFSLYYNYSDKITESRVCKSWGSNRGKAVAIILCSLENNIRLIHDIDFNPNILKSIKFYLNEDKYNIRRMQRKVYSIRCLETYTSHIDKIRKNERENWVLYRGLRREEDIVRNQRKPCSDQKISYLIEIMFRKLGLVLDDF